MLYPLQRAFTHGIVFDFQVALWKGRVGIANSNVSIAIGMEKCIDIAKGIRPEFLRLKLRLMEVSWIAQVHKTELRTWTLMFDL